MVESLLEKDIIPEWLIRFRIRQLLGMRLKQEKKAGLEAEQKHFMEFIDGLKKAPIAIMTAKANEQHYEVPVEFYEHVMGKFKKYSCGIWPNEVKTLDESEEAMLALTCERGELKDGMTVLDLGCGWGSLSLFIAERFPKCKITSVSNSKTQKAYIDSEAKRRGLKNVEVITADMNDFKIGKKFDRVFSVEMLEHMKNYQKLFHKISGFMKPNALFFIHIFSHIRNPYHYEVVDDTDWMAKYFFSGGMMPSDHLFLYFQDDLKIQRHWRVNGQNYAKTSEAWLSNMKKNREKIWPILEDTYGKESALKWWVYWKVFFMSCAELWNYKKGEEWIVSHYLLRKG